MVRGCALIDSRLDTAKIGSDGRVEVHRARLRAVFGGRKRFHTAWTRNGHWVWRSDRDRHFASRIDHGARTAGEWPICHGVSRRAFNERGGAGFEIS